MHPPVDDYILLREIFRSIVRQAQYRHDLKTFIIPFTIITALHVAAIIYATTKILLAN